MSLISEQNAGEDLLGGSGVRECGRDEVGSLMGESDLGEWDGE